MLDITLDSGNGYRCRKCAVLHQFLTDLGRVQPGIFFPEPVYLPFRLIRDHPGAALIASCPGDQGLHTTFFIELIPFCYGFGFVLEDPPIRQTLRGKRHPAAVFGHGGVCIKTLQTSPLKSWLRKKRWNHAGFKRFPFGGYWGIKFFPQYF